MNRWQWMAVMAGLGLVAGAAVAGPVGARDALQVLERERGAQVVVNVVGIVGFNGDDQPAVWKLLVRDGGDAAALQEFSVSGDKVTGQAPVPRSGFADLPDKPLMGAALRVDSTEAYRIADDEAILAGASFVRIHYQLRFRGNDKAPTWLLTLVDASGGTVGHVVVDASDGSIPFQDFPGASLVTSPPQMSETRVDTTYSTRVPPRSNRIVGPRAKRGGGFQ